MVVRMGMTSLQAMPTLKTLNDAAKAAKVSRRLLQVWLGEGRLKRWQIPGDNRRYVDMDEVKAQLVPRIVPLKPKPK